MLRWRSSSNQTCSWQSARHRKETGRCGTAKMGMKMGLVLWGISPVFVPFLVSFLGNINEFLSIKGWLDTFPVSGDQVHDGDGFSDGENVWLFTET